MQPKQYEAERVKNQFVWYTQFILKNWPADPFCGVWIEAEHLPDAIVATCQLAQVRLSTLPQSPGLACFRRRGQTREVRVEPGWLDSYLRDCAIVEPDAHEKEGP